jgi:hypothetical protein
MVATIHQKNTEKLRQSGDLGKNNGTSSSMNRPIFEVPPELGEERAAAAAVAAQTAEETARYLAVCRTSNAAETLSSRSCRVANGDSKRKNGCSEGRMPGWAAESREMAVSAVWTHRKKPFETRNNMPLNGTTRYSSAETHSLVFRKIHSNVTKAQ